MNDGYEAMVGSLPDARSPDGPMMRWSDEPILRLTRYA